MFVECRKAATFFIWKRWACERLLQLAGYMGTLEKRYDTDSPLCVRRIASAKIMEISWHCEDKSSAFILKRKIWGCNKMKIVSEATERHVDRNR